ncbi:PspC domain-containing protein [Cellvibrio sp. KY-GH-1]|uniref:PspC domain-containing protein n=1 Tax=Cellvibrio sp. KY-GH-1 TaxID=2303332 RepID=UPI001247895F|nr:PspC domain-containing protein [Cellvibrio sp. KY-GH-1]QEY18112.1 PspC domain-containing protein [Cellvibrio sp. KY-GH-1]
MNNKQLTKSNNKVISGICGGIAEFLDWPASKVRWLWALITIFTGGTLILAYILCIFVFPNPPKEFDLNDFRKQ